MNETLADAIFFFLTKLQINKHVNEPHRFKAKIRNGDVRVECRGYECYIESRYDDGKTAQFAGTTVAAANRLEALGIEFESIEMEENEK